MADAQIRQTAVGETEMAKIGARLAKLLLPGDLLLLRGDLGAGKTTLTRAIVSGLESPAAVSSPTFALIHVYEGGRLPVVHADAYRLTGAADLQTTGLEDYVNAGDAVVIIEWPERIEGALPDTRLEISIEEAGDDARDLTITGRGSRWASVAESVGDGTSGC